MTRLGPIFFASLLCCAAGCRPRSSTGGVADGAVLPDGGGDGGADSLAARTQAVLDTIAHDATCNTLPQLYWEIGDVHGALASGSVGTSFAADTQMNIASATKWLWGAYVVERFKDDPGAIDLAAMTMKTGYVSLSYDTCVLSSTVQDCFAAASNSTHTAADDGVFYYNGGHFQKYAIDLGLGGDDKVALAAEFKKYLGADLAFTFSSPQLAAGARTSPSDYAAFLRKILAGSLAIAAELDANAVCTLPSACPTAAYSPAPAAWHYAYAHWIEDDPTSGDGAFSSPGAFGFYPWIDASKQYYGILARYVVGSGAYLESANCGRLLRKAFLTGQPQ